MAETSGFIYGKFRNYVDKQINIRQNVLSKLERSPEDLFYLTGKTAWAKMTSAVNFTSESFLAKKYNLYGDEIAKQYQLFGGTLLRQKTTDDQGQTKEFDVLRTGFGASRNQGIQSNINYGLGGYKEAGFKPMPGIESVTVKSKNQFGSLREANIKFKCWNLEQLDILESLYMRPGYQILLEWGHTVYYNNAPSIISGNKIKFMDFFSPKLNSVEDICKEIDNIKVTSGGNYDGMVGIIKNFSFTANPDGSYSCSTDLVTWGEVVESLKISVAPTNDSVNEQAGIDNEVKEKKIAESAKTFLEALLNKIKQVKKFPPSSPEQQSLENELAPYLNSVYYWSINPSSDFYTKKTETVTRNSGEWVGAYALSSDPNSDKATVNYFITLRDILALINNACLLTDQNNKKILTINNSIDENIALTTPIQFSVDPGVCLWPCAYSGISNPNSNTINITDFLDSNNPHKMKFMNIPVNVDYVVRVLNENINKENGEVDLLVFLKALMNGISSAMGTFNKYDVSVNDFNTINIVDTQLIPLNYGESPSTLVLSNKNSSNSKTFGFCYSYNFSSRITSKLTNTIAISAQANNSSLNLDNTAFSKLNIGLEDRYAKEKIFPSTGNIDEESSLGKSQIFQFLQEFSKGWTERGGQSGDVYYATFTPEDISKAKSYLKDLLNSIKNKLSEGSAFIPIDLNISIEGISGIRIGECFLIESDKLPKNYKYVTGSPKIKFMVRTIDHSVTNNLWTTNVTALSVVNQKSFKNLNDTTDAITNIIFPNGYVLNESDTSSGVTISANPEANQNTQPTSAAPTGSYTDDEYKVLAGRLFAAMDGGGTDTTEIKNVLSKINNDVDMDKLRAAWGRRTTTAPLSRDRIGGLDFCLSDEGDIDDIKEYNSILSGKVSVNKLLVYTP